MVSLAQLWLPILLGTVFAWVASAVIHMVLKYHNSDYKKLSNEDEVAGVLRGTDVGFYTVPYCVDPKEFKNEALQQKFKQGPVGFVTIMPSGMPNMGKAMIQQILFFLIGALLIAYCAVQALPAGAEYLSVFRVCGAIGFLAFGWASVPYSIWMGVPWSNTFKYLLDALIYALVVAGTFAWLWPAAT